MIDNFATELTVYCRGLQDSTSQNCYGSPQLFNTFYPSSKNSLLHDDLLYAIHQNIIFKAGNEFHAYPLKAPGLEFSNFLNAS